jgi:hypothetical protein
MMQPASVALRWIYCLALAVIFYPTVISLLGWIGISHGKGTAGMILAILWILFLALGVWRIFKVATRADTLDSHVYSGIVKVLRVIGIVGMVLSLVYLVFQIGFAAYLSLNPKPGNQGMTAYVAGLYIALLGGLTPLGLWIFEVSRLFGFERNSREGN